MDLDAVCKTICTNAAEEYNRSADIRILADSIRFGIAAGAKKIDMNLQMQYRNGSEPNGDLRDSECNDAISAFRTILDRQLREAGIELTLGTVLVPPKYYQG